MALGLQEITLAVIIGALSAIIYALRVLVLMERRVERIEMHIENMANKIIREEVQLKKGLKRR